MPATEFLPGATTLLQAVGAFRFTHNTSCNRRSATRLLLLVWANRHPQYLSRLDRPSKAPEYPFPPPQKRVVMLVNHCGDTSTSPVSRGLSRPVTISSPIPIRNSPRACFIALLVADMLPRQRNKS